MPVTRSRNGFYDPANTTSFLFGDDEPHAFNGRDTPDESFPTLVRRDDQMVSSYFIAFLSLRLLSSRVICPSHWPTSHIVAVLAFVVNQPFRGLHSNSWRQLA